MDEKMEIRLVNPTEDGFLQKIDWNKAELEENVRSIVAAYQGLAICMDAFGIVSSEAGKMKGQVNAITNKYNMNRAQRRQEGKKNKYGKNGAVVTPIGNASGRDNS